MESKSWRSRYPNKVRHYYMVVDKARVSERTRRYRKHHPGRSYEITKRYRKTPAGMLLHRLENNARYHKLREIPGFCTSEQLLARYRFYGGQCWLCGKPAADSIDHVIPISQGGTNWPANLRPACRICNARKGNRRVYVG